MDVVVKTSSGFEIATKVGTHPVYNRATYEAQLFSDGGPLQVSATAYSGPVVIEAIPVVATISAGNARIVPQEEGQTPKIIKPSESIKQSEEFQKPDDFISEKQCPIGTNLVDGKCVIQTLQDQPLVLQFTVILLLLLLTVGLLLAIGIRRRKEKQIVASQLLFETKDEVIKPPRVIEEQPSEIRLQKIIEEESNLVKILESLQTQEKIQKQLHLLETQLLEHVTEEAEIRKRLAILLQIVEIRIKLVHPLLPQLKSLPVPKRTYKKKRKVLSVEHKAKIAAARKGKKQTQETKQKIAESRTGKKMSESTKQKISKAKKVQKSRSDAKTDELDELIRRYNVIADEEYSNES